MKEKILEENDERGTRNAEREARNEEPVPQGRVRKKDCVEGVRGLSERWAGMDRMKNSMKQLSEASPLEQMIQQQVVERGIHDQRVINALRQIPRDKFFPNGSRDDAFADRAAPIGHGQTISQPYMVALMTSRLDVRDGHTVLELGTGSGYQTAILA